MANIKQQILTDVGQWYCPFISTTIYIDILPVPPPITMVIVAEIFYQSPYTLHTLQGDLLQFTTLHDGVVPKANPRPVY